MRDDNPENVRVPLRRPREGKRPARSDALPIDKIDARILRVLQRDARISNVALAESVHLSPAAVFDRVKRLVRDGVIVGFEARLDPMKLGMELSVLIEVSLDRNDHRAREHFSRQVRQLPQILECHLLAGSYDYLLKARVPSIEAYSDSVGALLGELPYVRECRAYTVVEEVKNSSTLPV